MIGCLGQWINRFNNGENYKQELIYMANVRKRYVNFTISYLMVIVSVVNRKFLQSFGCVQFYIKHFILCYTAKMVNSISSSIIGGLFNQSKRLTPLSANHK